MGLSEILSNVGSGIAKGADELGKAIPLPILSPLLRLPEHLIQQSRNQAQETQLQGALSSLEGTPAHSSPTLQRHLLYPTAPAQGSPREGGGLQMAGADPLLPANFQKGQPLPRPSAQEIPQGQQIAQGPPRMVPSVGGQVTVPAQPPNSKDFLKMLGSIHTPESYARLKKDDPLQYKRLMALRGIANYDQGNATAGVMDLTEAGLSPTNAIAVLQQQRRQKDMSNFLAKTGGTAPPSAPSPGVLAGTGGASAQQPFPKSREQYLAENLPKLAGIKEPTNLAQAHALIMTNAQGYQPMAVLSKQEAGRVGADYATSLTPSTTTEQARQSMAKIMQRVPKALAPEVGKALKDAYQTFVAERKNAETEQFRQASTRLKQSGIGPKVIAAASSLYHQMVASNPAVKDVFQMEPYYHRAMAVYGKALTGSPMAQIPFIESYIRSFSNQALRAYLLSKNIDVQSLSQKMEGKLQQIKNGGAGFTADSLTQMKDILDSAHEANLESIAPTIAHFSKASESGGPEISKAFKEMVGGIPKPSSSTGQKVGDRIDLGNGIKGTIIGVSP